MIDVIIKNEFLKLSKQKKPLVFLILALLATGMPAFMIGNEDNNTVAYTVFKTIISQTNQIIIIFGILIISEIITQDCENGTIKMSAIQPINRSTIILGKLIYVEIIVLIMYVVVAILSFIMTSIFVGIPNINMILELLKSIMLSSITITSFLTIISFLSIIITSASLVTTLSILILFLSDIVISLLSFLIWMPKDIGYLFVTKYFTLFFNKLPDVENIKIYATIAIAVPLIVFTLATIKVFERKELNY